MRCKIISILLLFFSSLIANCQQHDHPCNCDAQGTGCDCSCCEKCGYEFFTTVENGQSLICIKGEDCLASINSAPADIQVLNIETNTGVSFGPAINFEPGINQICRPLPAPGTYKFTLRANCCGPHDQIIRYRLEEICNSWDDNGDGVIDNVSDANKHTFYKDEDGDEFGDPNNFIRACFMPTDTRDKFVTNSLDCDDMKIYFEDADGDGYGNGQVKVPCPGQHSSPDNSDCDDHNKNKHPNARELCNCGDDNCNTTTDEITISLSPANPKPICYTSAVTLAVAQVIPTAEGPVTGRMPVNTIYHWKLNGVPKPGNQPSYEAKESGQYSVEAEIPFAKPNECSNSIFQNCKRVTNSAQLTVILEENEPTLDYNGSPVAIRRDGHKILIKKESGGGILMLKKPLLNLNDIDYSYQWFKDGNAISGANEPRIPISGFARNNPAGAYYLEIKANKTCIRASETVTVRLVNEVF